MWFLFLLFIANPVAVECFSDYESNLQQFSALNQEFENQIASMNLDKEIEEKTRKSMMSDPIGVQLGQAKACLNVSKTSSSDSYGFDPLTGAAAGSIVGAIVAIIGTDGWQKRRILKNGKAAILRELGQIETILQDKVEFNNAGTIYRYAPYVLTTAAFDSLVSSGAFLRFGTFEQRRLVTLYFHIKEHNRMINSLRNLIRKARTEHLRPQTRLELIRSYQRIVASENRITERYLCRVVDIF